MNAKCPFCGKCVGHDGAGLKPMPVKMAWFRRSFFPHWQAECEAAMFSLAEVVALSGRQRSMSACIEVLRSLPRPPSTLDDCEATVMCARYLLEAKARQPGPRFEAALEGIRRIENLDEDWRALLEASLTGMHLGWTTAG